MGAREESPIDYGYQNAKYICSLLRDGPKKVAVDLWFKIAVPHCAALLGLFACLSAYNAYSVLMGMSLCIGLPLVHRRMWNQWVGFPRSRFRFPQWKIDMFYGLLGFVVSASTVFWRFVAQGRFWIFDEVFLAFSCCTCVVAYFGADRELQPRLGKLPFVFVLPLVLVSATLAPAPSLYTAPYAALYIGLLIRTLVGKSAPRPLSLTSRFLLLFFHAAHMGVLYVVAVENASFPEWFVKAAGVGGQRLANTACPPSTICDDWIAITFFQIHMFALGLFYFVLTNVSVPNEKRDHEGEQSPRNSNFSAAMASSNSFLLDEGQRARRPRTKPIRIGRADTIRTPNSNGEDALTRETSGSCARSPLKPPAETRSAEKTKEMLMRLVSGLFILSCFSWAIRFPSLPSVPLLLISFFGCPFTFFGHDGCEEGKPSLSSYSLGFRNCLRNLRDGLMVVTFCYSAFIFLVVYAYNVLANSWEMFDKIGTYENKFAFTFFENWYNTHHGGSPRAFFTQGLLLFVMVLSILLQKQIQKATISRFFADSANRSAVVLARLTHAFFQPEISLTCALLLVVLDVLSQSNRTSAISICYAVVLQMLIVSGSNGVATLFRTRLWLVLQITAQFASVFLLSVAVLGKDLSRPFREPVNIINFNWDYSHPRMLFPHVALFALATFHRTRLLEVLKRKEGQSIFTDSVQPGCIGRSMTLMWVFKVEFWRFCVKRTLTETIFLVVMTFSVATAVLAPVDIYSLILLCIVGLSLPLYNKRWLWPFAREEQAQQNYSKTFKTWVVFTVKLFTSCVFLIHTVAMWPTFWKLPLKDLHGITLQELGLVPADSLIKYTFFGLTAIVARWNAKRLEGTVLSNAHAVQQQLPTTGRSPTFDGDAVHTDDVRIEPKSRSIRWEENLFQTWLPRWLPARAHFYASVVLLTVVFSLSQLEASIVNFTMVLVVLLLLGRHGQWVRAGDVFAFTTVGIMITQYCLRFANFQEFVQDRWIQRAGLRWTSLSVVRHFSILGLCFVQKHLHHISLKSAVREPVCPQALGQYADVISVSFVLYVAAARRNICSIPLLIACGIWVINREYRAKLKEDAVRMKANVKRWITFFRLTLLLVLLYQEFVRLGSQFDVFQNPARPWLEDICAIQWDAADGDKCVEEWRAWFMSKFDKREYSIMDFLASFVLAYIQQLLGNEEAEPQLSVPIRRLKLHLMYWWPCITWVALLIVAMRNPSFLSLGGLGMLLVSVGSTNSDIQTKRKWAWIARLYACFFVVLIVVVQCPAVPCSVASCASESHRIYMTLDECVHLEELPAEKMATDTQMRNCVDGDAWGYDTPATLTLQLFGLQHYPRDSWMVALEIASKPLGWLVVCFVALSVQLRIYTSVGYEQHMEIPFLAKRRTCQFQRALRYIHESHARTSIACGAHDFRHDALQSKVARIKQQVGAIIDSSADGGKHDDDEQPSHDHSEARLHRRKNNLFSAVREETWKNEEDVEKLQLSHGVSRQVARQTVLLFSSNVVLCKQYLSILAEVETGRIRPDGSHLQVLVAGLARKIQVSPPTLRPSGKSSLRPSGKSSTYLRNTINSVVAKWNEFKLSPLLAGLVFDYAWLGLEEGRYKVREPDEVAGEELHEHRKDNSPLRVFWKFLLSRSQVWVAISATLAFVETRSVLDFLRVFAIFFVGLRTYPMPRREYWTALRIYSVALLVFRYLYNLPFFCTGSVRLQRSESDSMFLFDWCPAIVQAGWVEVIGISKRIGPQAFYLAPNWVAVIWADYLCIFTLLLHQWMLIDAGIWQFVQVDDESKKLRLRTEFLPELRPQIGETVIHVDEWPAGVPHVGGMSPPVVRTSSDDSVPAECGLRAQHANESIAQPLRGSQQVCYFGPVSSKNPALVCSSGGRDFSMSHDVVGVSNSLAQGGGSAFDVQRHVDLVNFYVKRRNAFFQMCDRWMETFAVEHDQLPYSGDVVEGDEQQNATPELSEPNPDALRSGHTASDLDNLACRAHMDANHTSKFLADGQTMATAESAALRLQRAWRRKQVPVQRVILRCYQGHRLAHSRQETRSEEQLELQPVCDSCHRSQTNVGWWSCSQCEYALCQSCAMDRVRCETICRPCRSTAENSKDGVALYWMKLAIGLFLIAYSMIFNKELVEDDRTFQESLQENTFSYQTILLIAFHLVLVIGDRIWLKLYSRNLGLKVGTFQKILLRFHVCVGAMLFIGLHSLVIYWLVVGGEDWNEQEISLRANWALNVYYLAFMVYFAVSLTQSKFGFPRFQHDTLRTCEDPEEQGQIMEKVRYYYFLLHYHLPFVDDLRVIIDWSVIRTTLDLFMYFKVEDAHSFFYRQRHIMFTRRQSYYAEVRGCCEKVTGCLILLLVFALILMPMIAFSPISPFDDARIINAHLYIDVSFATACTDNFSYKWNCMSVRATVYDAPIKRIEDWGDVEDMKEWYLKQNPEVGSNTDLQDVFWSQYSQKEFLISTAVKAEIFDILQAEANVIVEFQRRISISHYNGGRQTLQETLTACPNILTESSWPNGFGSCRYSDGELFQQVRQWWESQVYMRNPLGDPTVLRLPGFWPNSLHLTSSQADLVSRARPLHTELQPKTLDFTISLTHAKACGGKASCTTNSLWGTIMEPEDGRILFEIERFTKAGKGSALGSATALYVGVVYVVGRLLRSAVQDTTKRAIYEEMPDVGIFLDMVVAIQIARNHGDFRTEFQLYYELMKILRSTEILLAVGGHELHNYGVWRTDPCPKENIEPRDGKTYINSRNRRRITL